MKWEEAVEWLRSQPDKYELAKAAYYDEPAIEAAKRFAASEEWQEISRMLKGRMPCRVLDIGAGNGISSYAFARSGCAVTALEPDPSAKVGARAIKALLAGARMKAAVVQGYAEQLPFADGAFDVVYGRQVLHHAEDLGALCREAARVLRPDGLFVMTREHVISKKEDLAAFLESHPLHALYGGENAFLLKDYRRAIEAAGLGLVAAYGPHESPVNYFPRTRIEKKEEIREIMGRYVGRFAAGLVLGTEIAQRTIFRLLSFVDHTPGRLYSFVAVRRRNG